MKKILIRGLAAAGIVLAAFETTMAQTAELRKIKQMEANEKPSLPQDPDIKRPTAQYTAENLRDPFESPLPKDVTESPNQYSGSGETSLPPMNVQGVTWGARFPQAIINNQVFKVGDEIAGAKIIEIDQKGVTLSFQDKQYIIASPAGGALKEDEPRRTQ